MTIGKPGSNPDPLWYKDAVIYELHVKAFADSNNDGIGDFQGLIQKLDYLQDLGVTCLWVLPFFPSPLRDDGYDISDYMNVNPSYGTIDDFRQFLDAAHERGLQVLIELVINHTSDQHPWFQRARHAPPGSPERDFYVWSGTDQKYQDARIIFTDTEKSNWTWDPVAQAYFWHRFFSHQPDLNYDNPLVMEEILKILRYWLDMGADGLRIDAIPYLVERDGTNCENLAETHAVIRAIRSAIDEGYANRMVLAEANQWPTDVRPYFGDGDECHMAFHFPLMPRIYMALRQEDRLPITDIMAQTPDIPDNCQWGLFLRNHDELTLEMVTDDERDYMYLAYSADPRMRINIGIRRRLAPLLDNNRRRIELLNSLLFSFPGTPILYYGDEIGMGDNIYLGDRNGVRTPMQWTADRNGGFSRSNPARLYSPLIMDPVWGYEAINVEAQQSDPSSLLNWMRNMIALRKLFQVFGRGSLRFLNPSNRKILAYARQLDGEQVLCVANLSRFAQPVQLDLAEFDGMVPVEMLGYVEFPAITKQPYPLTLAPYGFLWLELQPSREAPDLPAKTQDDHTFQVAGETDWESILTGDGVRRLENVLPEFLLRQRWFGGKSRTIRRTAVNDWAPFDEQRSALICISVDYDTGEADNYLMLLSMSFGPDAESIRSSPNQVLASVETMRDTGVLHDALQRRSSCTALLELLKSGGRIVTHAGVIEGSPDKKLAELCRDAGELPPRIAGAEQSNSSVLFDDRLIMKLFRRQQPGPNPDTEIGRFLAERSTFTNIAPFCGSIEYQPKGSEASTLAMLQGLVANEGDGWQWTLEELERYYEGCASSVFQAGARSGPAIRLGELTGWTVPPEVHEHAGLYLEAAGTLGRRTAELHQALAGSTDDPAFAPEPLTPEDLFRLRETAAARAVQALDALKANLATLPDDVVETAGLALGRRKLLLGHFRKNLQVADGGKRTRVHGDYHLGQVLRVKSDFVILDFEGEPARSLAERRAKHSPLKDVAGMLRSFSYAAYAALIKYTTRRPEDFHQLEPWARLWEISISAEFLRGYRQVPDHAAVCPQSAEDFDVLLETYLMDKALYELEYELNNRPAWIHIPLAGILSLPL
ncbi:maltose alpha-D-glucosyltransferase [Paracidobacterium acidisoli]|uniref:Maltokinase n=1 Tax=Paracidobacterium acidisoli TaxID=2303751 RepID=A0A372IUT1_9BACT|nr:maltose alpha-D-glucosyltransferase [Paracidobacterium acidisoli]MBT9329496.1 maltose alpha-D-glucosyltransferase [Paracidobacterium acidisoli]